MESAGHFIFELLKIALLGYVYATLLILLFKTIAQYYPNEHYVAAFQSKKRLWLRISAALLFFMFTPWGNHGLGDSARIPVGFTRSVQNINWNEYARFGSVKSSEGNEIEMTRFKIANNKLCGNLDSDFDDFKNAFFICDLSNSKMTEFKSQNEYDNHAMQHGLPKADELLSFSDNYSDYWHGWRFFLLP